MKAIADEFGVHYATVSQIVKMQRSKNVVMQQYCFTYRGNPIRRDLTNTAWVNAIRQAGIEDFRFHDLRHTWASWHRQAGTSCDELKDLGGWKSWNMVDRYAKFATENLAFAASRIESKRDSKVVTLSR